MRGVGSVGPRWRGRCAGAVVGALAALLAVAAEPAAAERRDGACKHRDPSEPAAFGGTKCPGVRPGGLVHIEPRDPIRGEPAPEPFSGPPPLPHCTLGFMWRAGTQRYISTAGHCVGTEGRWQKGTGPAAYDGDRRRIGEVVYSGWSHPLTTSKDLDFALIRLDRDVRADPTVCHFGGPTGLNKSEIDQAFTPPNLIALRYYGNGFAGGHVPGVGWVLPARTGFSHGLPDPRWLHFTGVLSQRDSGAPIMTADGRAVALVSVAGGVDGSTYVGSARSPRLAHQVAAAEKALGVALELDTARLRGPR